MTEIFAYKINNDLSRDKWRELISVLSYSEKSRVGSFKKKSNAQTVLISRYLLRRIISIYTDINPADLKFSANSYGKPVLIYPKAQNLYFNMSHSGDWIVGGVSRHKQIGIDVERIRPIDIAIAEDHFSRQELEYINSGNDLNFDGFFEIWTLKESFIKAIGKGLHYPLKNFYFEFSSLDKINIKFRRKTGDWNFKFYNIDPYYKLAVCLKGDKFPAKVKILDI